MVGRVSSLGFVGRHEELAALEAALGRAREGVGTVVLVAGEAGMGKSRLISEAAGRAERDGMTVVVGECLPLGEGEVAYAAVVGAVRSLMRQRQVPELEAMADPAGEELAALLPELSLAGDVLSTSASDGGSQSRLFTQLMVLLAAGARTAPLMLVLEDFQWADRSTCDFLGFLVRAARNDPIALVLGFRSDELRRRHPLRPFVLELERSGQAIRIDLGPFTRSELGEQVAGILDRPPSPQLIDRLLERSEGNPFFAEELLASASGPGDALPESLLDTMLARVEAQPASVRHVVQIAAVAGRTADHELLQAGTDLSTDELNLALRDAVESYLLVPDSSTAGYSFRHALLREAIYSDLLPGERRALHQRLARTLEKRPFLVGTKAAATAEIAHHWYTAGEWEAALPASLTAASAAEEVYALGEALLHYERALEIWDLARPRPRELEFERVEVLRRAAEAADRTGAQQRAITLAREVLKQINQRDDPVEAALAHERLGRYLWSAGRDQDALPECRHAVELIPATPPSAERAFVLAAEGQVLMLCNRIAESIPCCEEALAIARAVGAEAVEAHVLNTICGNLSAVGEIDRAVAAAREARTIAHRLRLPEQIRRSYVNGSDALSHAGRLEESIALAWEGISSLREFVGDPQWSDVLRTEVAARLVQSARWDEAEPLLEEVIDRAHTGVSAAMAYGHLGYLEAERGNFDAAARALERAGEQIRRSVGSMALAAPAAARASLEVWAGRPDAAESIVAECFERIGDDESVAFSARLYDLGARACAELAARVPGDERACHRHAARAHELLDRFDGLIVQLRGIIPPAVAASRAACAAECSRIGRDGDPALWAYSRQQWDACENRYQAACAGWREAEALLASGSDRPEAEALMRSSYAVADELGAKPLAEQLEALARRARIHLRNGDASEAIANPELQRLELTPRELEVLALLGDGLTNREIGAELFISEKTASVHVSRILSKLSVPNRAAAAALGQRLGVHRVESGTKL